MLYDDLVQPGEYICHHGVKGQKWGVRHDKETSGDNTIYFSTKRRKVPNLRFTGFKTRTGKTGMSTTYEGKKISFIFGDNHKYSIQDQINTTHRLIENWDNVNKMLNKGFNDVRDDIKNYYNDDMSNSSLSEFLVDGPNVTSFFSGDRGELVMTIDPTSYVIYGAEYHDYD